MLLVELLDAGLNWVWRTILSSLRRYIRLSNFAFARLFAGISGGVTLIYLIAYTVVDAQKPNTNWEFDVAFALVIAYMLFLSFQVTQRMEKYSKKGPVPVSVVLKDALKVKFCRLTLTMIAVTGLAIGAWISAFVLACLAGSFYFPYIIPAMDDEAGRDRFGETHH